MVDLSIVMQGPVLHKDKIRQDVIENIATTRMNFPTAEIILSTWNMDDTLVEALTNQLIAYSITIVFSCDPGPLTFMDNGSTLICNVNRMIVSTREGIKQATHPIVVKIRTDSCLYSDALLTVIRRHLLENDGLIRDEWYSVFSHRLINCNLFARDARGYRPYLFHPGDIMLAGYGKDLLCLFDVPLADTSLFEVSASTWFFSVMRYAPEQYIWVRCIEQLTGKYVFAGNACRSEALVQRSENYYIANYLPYSCEELGLHWSKYHDVYSSQGKGSVYRYRDWERMYLYYVYGERMSSTLSDYHRTVVTILMKFYFMLRTSLLRVPAIRRVAFRLVNKRRQ